MNFLEFLRFYFFLKSFPSNRGVEAHQDPTMLFSGIIWGDRLARRQALSRVFWPLKVALFQCGDALVEKVVSVHGFERFKDHFLSNESPKQFYLFDDSLIEGTYLEEDYEKLKWGYQECQSQAKKYFETEHKAIIQDWIQATNTALRSVFFLEDWKENLEEKKGDALIRICEEEENAKNVQVVCQILSVQRHFSGCRYSQDEIETIVSCCSRWFTLIDDDLDLLSDFESNQPNHILARLIQFGELDAWREKASTNWKKTCPQAAQWYQERLQEARQGFLKHFPVYPKLFLRLIESRAQKRKQSPF